MDIENDPAARRAHLRARLDAPTNERFEQALFGSDGLTFDDLLDVINPLQHLPVVGPIYRTVTDDELPMMPRLAGGFLFGGPVGLAFAAVNAVIDLATGDDISGHILTAAVDLVEPEEETSGASADTTATWSAVEPAAGPVAPLQGPRRGAAIAAYWAQQERANEEEERVPLVLPNI